MYNLEIGPGKQRLGPDWTTVGLEDCDAVDYVVEWGREPLPFPEGTFDLVYASHVIEHVPWYLTRVALNEVFRVLASRGSFEVHTVDFRKMVDYYLTGQAADDFNGHGLNTQRHLMRWIACRIFAFDGDDVQNGWTNNWHKALFDRKYLEECLRQSGFEDLQAVALPRDREHYSYNLGMSGRKP